MTDKSAAFGQPEVSPRRRKRLRWHFPGRMSLRLRLTLLFAAFTALVLIIVGVTAYSLTRRSLIDNVERQTEEAYQGVLSAMRGNPSATTRNAWVQTVPSDVLLYVNIYMNDLRGPFPPSLFAAFERLPRLPTVVSSANGNGMAGLVGEQNFLALVKNGELRTQVRDKDGTLWVIRAHQEIFSILTDRAFFDERVANVDAPTLIMVAMPVSGDTLMQLRNTLIQSILAALLLFPLGVWFLARRALAPLKRMTRAAADISSQDLSRRVPVPNSRDEVGELSVTLNRMLDRLQETFETQRRFTADASHELRTPVTAISGHANYLLRRTSPTEPQIEPLEIIRSEAQRMSKLVNDLLELARADAGLTVRREPMNLVEVIEQVAKELAPVAGQARIHAFSPEPLLEVEGDAGKLHQVVLNLVQNALNAGSAEVSVSLQREGRWARIEVLDNGPGIPEAALPNIFERFFRVDGARSTRGNGSGLGLAIVKWIVEQHQGKVEVESKIGEGTVFSVFIPASQAAPSAHEKREKRPVSRSVPQSRG